MYEPIDSTGSSRGHAAATTRAWTCRRARPGHARLQRRSQGRWRRSHVRWMEASPQGPREEAEGRLRLARDAGMAGRKESLGAALGGWVRATGATAARSADGNAGVRFGMDAVRYPLVQRLSSTKPQQTETTSGGRPLRAAILKRSSCQCSTTRPRRVYLGWGRSQPPEPLNVFWRATPAPRAAALGLGKLPTPPPRPLKRLAKPARGGG